MPSGRVGARLALLSFGVATLVSAPSVALAVPADRAEAPPPPPAPLPQPAAAPDADALAAQALARVAETQRGLAEVEAELARFEQTVRAGDLKGARAALTGFERLCARPRPELEPAAAAAGFAGVVTASAEKLQQEHLRRHAELCAGLPEMTGRLAEAQLRQRMDRVAAALPALKAGTRDAESVRQLKTMLGKAVGARLTPKNPAYGPSTTAAVRRFQTERGLPVTGRVDRLTWRELLVANGGPLAPAFFGGKAPSERAATAVRAALSQLGLPYEWGAVKPGESFDCSGLTSWAYQQAGVRLPRHSTDQAIGSPVSREELRPGDLIVWQGHVGMYVDKGKMIEAGDPVRLTAVRTTNVGMPFLGFFRPTA